MSKWTTGRPKKTGWYWHKPSDYPESIQMAHVITKNGNGELYAIFHSDDDPCEYYIDRLSMFHGIWKDAADK